MFKSTLPCWIVLCVVTVVLLPGCVTMPKVVAPHPDAQSFSVMRPYARIEASREERENPEYPEYYLVLFVDPIGVDYSSPEKMMKTFHKQPRGSKFDNAVGHSWVLLGHGSEFRECGHTGENGLHENTYYLGVLELAKYGDPNPAAYLFEAMSDGRYVPHDAGHTPQMAVQFALTREEYERVYEYIDTYDYEVFSLTERQCTFFASGAARAAGIDLGSKVTIALPQTVEYEGEVYTLWTDPQYSMVTYSAPGVFERSLMMALEKGYGRDVLNRYLE